MFRKADSSLPPSWWNPALPSPTRREAPSILAPGDRRALGDATIPLGTLQTCSRCGAAQHREVMELPHVALYRWSDCQCISANRAQQDAIVAQARARMIARDTALLGDTGASRIARYTLDTFDPNRLRPVADVHPYTLASAWLAALFDRDRSDRDVGPPGLLWFYSPTKGTGKTHLAAACYWEAQRMGKRVAFIEEMSYLNRSWNMPFGEARELLIALPGELAWLSVLDDLGRRDPGRSPASTQNAWNDILSRRYLASKWTLVTSNYTPDELQQRGTLDDASVSRIYELSRGQIIVFDGADQRRRLVDEAP